MGVQRRKTILFFPLNSPGHINSSLGIADILLKDFNCRTIFLLLGESIGTSIQDHGHELVILDEVNPFQDYEIEDDEDPCALDEEAKRKQGKSKKKFSGVLMWPQVIRRHSHILRGDPLEAFINSVPVMEKSMVGQLIENFDNYAKTISDIAPDLIVVDAYYIPPCIVNSKTPWIRLYSANPLILTQSKLPDGVKPPPMSGVRLYDKETREKIRRENPEQWNNMLREWRQANERIGQVMSKAGGPLDVFFTKHNCPPLAPGQQAHESPYLNVYMFPEALDYDQDDDMFGYSKLWLRCDSLMRQQPQAGSQEAKELSVWKERLESAVRGKEAVVFFSLGSIASGDWTLMKKYVDYLKHDQKRLFVVSKGVNGHKYQLDDGNMIGANYIPQTYFLKQADLAIIHGGNNSVTECMYYGKPMIVLPLFGDQIDNAQRVEDLKFGRRLDVHHCTQDQLFEAINDILNDKKMIDRAHCVGEQMRSRDDLMKVTGLVKKLVDQGTLSQEDIESCRQKSH